MFENQLANGLALGGAYALVAIGYSLVFGVLRVVNLAHGDIFLAGALVGFELGRVTHSLVLLILGTLVVTAILGIVLERFVLRRLRGEELAILTATIAVALLLESIGEKLTGNHSVAFPDVIPQKSVNIAGLTISQPSLIMVIVSVLICAGLAWVLRSTSIGRQIRATASDEDTASMLGVRVGRVRLMTIAFASMLGGVAGFLVAASLGAVSVGMGTTYGLKGLVILIVGGLGSMSGAAVIGFALGIGETLIIAYGPGQYTDAITFGLLILVLLFRPQGLFGRATVDRA